MACEVFDEMVLTHAVWVNCQGSNGIRVALELPTTAPASESETFQRRYREASLVTEAPNRTIDEYQKSFTYQPWRQYKHSLRRQILPL